MRAASEPNRWSRLDPSGILKKKSEMAWRQVDLPASLGPKTTVKGDASSFSRRSSKAP